MGQLAYLVIHCTDTLPRREVTSDELRRWHMSPVAMGGRGWKQVGYADMIHIDGRVENLVPYNSDNIVDPWEVTNGALGYNGNSRHVVYVGGRGFSGRGEDTRTKEQLVSLTKYVKDFLAVHPNCKVCGHYQVNPGRDCPSFNVPIWLKSIGIAQSNIL